jgi:hypothetical protein
VGFYPVAVALQNDTQIKHNTNKTYHKQNTDNIHIKYTKHTHQIHKTYTSNTQNIHIEYTKHTHRIHKTYTLNTQNIYIKYTKHTHQIHKTYTSNINTTQNTTLKKEKEDRNEM